MGELVPVRVGVPVEVPDTVGVDVPVTVDVKLQEEETVAAAD